MADNLYNPPPPDIIEGADPTIQGVRILTYLDDLKHSTAIFDQTVGDSTNTDPNGNNQVLERSHSVDVLHEFSNVIVDVVMGYVILQTHALSAPPMTTTQRKKNYRKTRSSTRRAENEGEVLHQNTSTELEQAKETSMKQLQKIQSRQNFQPLVFFLLGGVRGLFLVSRDHRNASLSDCMSFSQAMGIIMEHSKTPRSSQESIWKNLSSYLVQLLQPSLLSSQQVIPLCTPPTRNKLAEVITTDFLNHWKEMQPTSPFLIPNSSQRQITENWITIVFSTYLLIVGVSFFWIKYLFLYFVTEKILSLFSG